VDGAAGSVYFDGADYFADATSVCAAVYLLSVLA
jgi:hypothetical protein